jgi:hypothetical protein
MHLATAKALVERTSGWKRDNSPISELYLQGGRMKKKEEEEKGKELKQLAEKPLLGEEDILFTWIAKRYVHCCDVDMAGRAPGRATLEAVSLLEGLTPWEEHKG